MNKFDRWVERNGLKGTKAEKTQFEKVAKIRKEFDAAKAWREASCYWGADGAGSTDWNERWTKQEKLWLGWYKPLDKNNFQSNIKIPETTGRVESLFQRITNSDILFDAISSNETRSSRAHGKIASASIDTALYEADASYSEAITVKDALIHGTAIFEWVYKKVTNKVRYPKTKNLTEQEKKEIKDGKIIYGEPEEKVLSEGFSWEPIPRNEVYESPKGTELQGNQSIVDYVIRRSTVTEDAFKDEFEGNPNAMNLDKVKPASDYKADSEQDIFRASDVTSGKKYIEVLRYQNLKKDQYMVVANDQLILDQALPYNHKRYTYHKIDCIKKPFSFNGIGLPDWLENLEGHEEIVLNMMIDKVFRGLNQKYFIESNVYGSVAEQLIEEDSQFIAVDSNDGRPLASKVAPLTSDFVNQDSFQILNVLGRYATMASQIDPAQMNLQKTNISATATQLSSMVVDGIVYSILKNMQRTLTFVGQHTYSMIKQKWGIPKVMKITGDNEKEETLKKYKKIQLKGFKVSFQDKEIELQEAYNKYSFLELTPDLLPSEDDIRIVAKPIRVKDKEQDKANFMQFYAQMMPNAIDPSDPQAANAPFTKLYDARVLAHKVAEYTGLEDTVCLSDGFDSEDDVPLAIDEVKRMVAGEHVIGIPGRSMAHNLYEKNVLDGLNSQIKGIKDQLEQSKVPGQPTMDQMGQMVPMPDMYDPELQQAYIDTAKIAAFIAEHLQLDILPKSQLEAAALMVGQQTQDEVLGTKGGQIPMPPQAPKGMNPQTGMMQNGGMNQIPTPQQPSAGPGRPPMPLA